LLFLAPQFGERSALLGASLMRKGPVLILPDFRYTTGM